MQHYDTTLHVIKHTIHRIMFTLQPTEYCPTLCLHIINKHLFDS